MLKIGWGIFNSIQDLRAQVLISKYNSNEQLMLERIIDKQCSNLWHGVHSILKVLEGSELVYLQWFFYSFLKRLLASRYSRCWTQLLNLYWRTCNHMRLIYILTIHDGNGVTLSYLFQSLPLCFHLAFWLKLLIHCPIVVTCNPLAQTNLLHKSAYIFLIDLEECQCDTRWRSI